MAEYGRMRLAEYSRMRWAEYSRIRLQNMAEYGRIWQNMAEHNRMRLAEYGRIWQNATLHVYYIYCTVLKHTNISILPRYCRNMPYITVCRSTMLLSLR